MLLLVSRPRHRLWHQNRAQNVYLQLVCLKQLSMPGNISFREEFMGRTLQPAVCSTLSSVGSCLVVLWIISHRFAACGFSSFIEGCCRACLKAAAALLLHTCTTPATKVWSMHLLDQRWPAGPVASRCGWFVLPGSSVSCECTTCSTARYSSSGCAPLGS